MEPKEKNKSRFKVLLAASGIVLLGAAGLYLLFNNSDQKNERASTTGSNKVVGVYVGEVSKHDLVATHVFSGTLIAEKQYDVAAKISGRIREINVDLGDRVKKGNLLVQLDSEEYQQELVQAQAELEVAKASLAEAKSSLVAAERNYQRAEKLRAQKVASVAELEDAETAKMEQEAGVSLAMAQVRQREAAIRTAEVRLSYTDLFADWLDDDETACRFVARRYVNEGELISANQPIVNLVDLSLLNAVIHVAEREYAFLQIGQAATISVDLLPDRTFTGKVVRMSPVFDELSRQARIEIAVLNKDYLLKSGMFAQVEVELERAEQVLAVPAAAVVQRNGVDGVFVVEADTTHFIKVRQGIKAKGWTQVDGLAPGTQVVTLGHHLLSDGINVSISPAEENNQLKPYPE